MSAFLSENTKFLPKIGEITGESEVATLGGRLGTRGEVGIWSNKGQGSLRGAVTPPLSGAEASRSVRSLGFLFF